MVAVALAGLATLSAAAAPSYDQARAFADSLMAVHDGSWREMRSPESSAAFSKKVNRLPQQSERLFGRQQIGGRFWPCEVAAHNAVVYWQDQLSVASSMRPPDRTATTALAKSGFAFGDAYRQCRNEVDKLDTTPPVPPECMRVIDLGNDKTEKPRPAHCNR